MFGSDWSAWHGGVSRMPPTEPTPTAKSWRDIASTGFNFDDVHDLAVERYPDGRFVEVGVYQGRSTAYLVARIRERGTRARVSVVDPWRDPWSNEDSYQAFLRNMRALGMLDAIDVHRRASPEAADAFDDASLDYVFIDGGHSYEEVAADLPAWWRKLKPGALIGGHDYADYGANDQGKMHPGVVQAVDEFVRAHGLEHRFRVSRSSWIIDLGAP